MTAVNYERLVRVIVRRFGNTGIAEDDLFQEGMIALLKAKKTYDEHQGVKFETYAAAIIRNRLIDIVRGKRLRTETESGGTQADMLTGRTLQDEVELIEKNELLQEVLDECSEIERAVFNAYFQGFSYSEICKIFAINNKKIDNTVQKIKKRIQQKSEG
jgi:RNA polymerase sporulation-specific sigma factor